jgi:peptidoglycan/LPS O-acetylase OafA/YrhL
VVLFHTGVGFTSGQLPFLTRNLWRCLTFGHDAVAVFIVLSGYCLMLPVARGDGHVVGGTRYFIARRAWRILPPYYAALLATLLLISLVPVLQTRTGTTWDDSLPAFALGPIATHLLVIHDLFPAWIFRINGPLWSVATEWQIYFFFPFLLLPVWRRSGSLVTLLVGFAVGCAPLWFAPSVAARCAPWYLGLFALGMCAASVGFSGRSLEHPLAKRLPWKLALWVLTGSCVLGTTVLVKTWFRVLPLSDALVGATTAALLVNYTECALNGGDRPKPMLLRLLESRPLVRLGHFSYSLYLTHLPIVALCYFGLRPFALSAQARMASLIALGVPASLAFAYVFFWLVERHFLGRPAVFAEHPGRSPKR